MLMAVDQDRLLNRLQATWGQTKAHLNVSIAFTSKIQEAATSYLERLIQKGAATSSNLTQIVDPTQTTTTMSRKTLALQMWLPYYKDTNGPFNTSATSHAARHARSRTTSRRSDAATATSGSDATIKP
jgi:hypothetical protein